MKYGLLAGFLAVFLLGFPATGNGEDRLVLVEEFTNYA